MANVDQMLAIASQTTSDMMRRAGQVGRTAMQNVFCPRRKQIKMNRLHWHDASPGK
jgi:hypothetical protein